MSSTERLVILLTRKEKASIAAKAKSAKLTMGEFVRRATVTYNPDDSLLEGLITQVEKSTAQANKALDDALKAITVSNKRIAGMGQAVRPKRSAKKAA
jgi:propanediol dehydratase small subunit